MKVSAPDGVKVSSNPQQCTRTHLCFKFGLAPGAPFIKACAVLQCSWKGVADKHTYYRCTMSPAGAACQHGFQRRRNARLGKTKSTGACFTYVTCMHFTHVTCISAQLDPTITILVVQTKSSDVSVSAAQLHHMHMHQRMGTLPVPAHYLHLQAAITVSLREQSSLQHASASQLGRIVNVCH